MKAFIEHLIKHNAFVQLVYRYFCSALIRFIGIFVKTDPKLVLISSFSGLKCDDSPLILFNAMKEDERFAGCRYIWAFKKPENFNIEGADKVKIDTLSYFIAAQKAGIWITNVNIERGLSFKKKNTIYLNTWHGTGPKKGGNAVVGRKDYDFSRVDIFCCDGSYTRDVFVKWFGANEESMLHCGRPREDGLMQPNAAAADRLRSALGIDKTKKIILYMPTWREYNNRELNWELWEDRLGGEYVVLVRKHHLSHWSEFDKRLGDFWFDVSNYPDVNDLYHSAYLLISDYSSTFFDFGLLGKPMLCYAYDYEQFEQSTGLFMNLKAEFPGGIKRTEDELFEAIANIDYEKDGIKAAEYCASYVSHKISATECCLNRLYELSHFN